MATRVSSYDLGYVGGQLSVYPEAIDSRYQLYEAGNNLETKLAQSLTFTGKMILVENNDGFPSSGILRIGPPPGEIGHSEMVYYDSKSKGVFKNLIRGFAGSRQNPWPLGSWVTQSVFAEHHNSVKDAVIKIETNLGLRDLPEPASLNGILKAQETRFYAPRAIFRAYPTKGKPGAKIRFQNFSTGPLLRCLWDFGDGTTSVEKNPMHVYGQEGSYTVKLNIITFLGAQGVATKNGYINISENYIDPFFYVLPMTNGITEGVSQETANSLGDPSLATKFKFVDQTDGNISQRYWVFDGDGLHDGAPLENNTLNVTDPNVHTTTFVYDKPGTYSPSLLILFENQSLERAFLKDSIVVI